MTNNQEFNDSKSGTPKNMFECDTLVVGAGLSGIVAAAKAATEGKRVIVVDAADRAGGRWSPERREGFQFGAGLNVADKGTWERVVSELNLEDNSVEIENGNSVVFTKKGWQSGTNLPDWEKFLAQPVESMPQGGVAGFLDRILEQRAFDLRLNSPVTELVIEKGKADWARIGTDQGIRFQECIWAADSLALAEVLAGEGAPEEGMERTSWLKQFVVHSPSPGVVLEFAHGKKLSEFTETLVLPLPGADKEKDRRYLVGAFLANRDASLAPKGREVSVWLLPLREHEWEDNHEIMKRIRSARRVIERSFPGFEKSVLFDRVQVLSHTITPQNRKSKKKAKEEIPNPFSNLRVFSDWSAPAGSHFPGVVEQLLSGPVAESTTESAN